MTSGPAPVLVDLEKMEAVPAPLRRAADGALVADWGQVPARVYVAGLSGDGHRTMTGCLRAIAAWLSEGCADIDTLPWASLRYSHTTAIRAALARAVSEGRYAPATANKHLAALRGTLKAAWRLGMMETDDYLRASDLRPISGSRLPAGRNVDQFELVSLLTSCRADDSAAGMRDAAVIGLAYLSGARRAELVALHVADVDLDPAAIRVVGKGGKQRLVPLSPTVGPLLEAWMGLRGEVPGPLFCPINRSGSLRLGHGITGEAIRQILSRRTLAAGLGAISPHDLRRTYAGDLLDAGADLPAVQQLMGHASPSTTSRYDRRGDKARRSAAERLSIDLEASVETTSVETTGGHDTAQEGDSARTSANPTSRPRRPNEVRPRDSLRRHVPRSSGVPSFCRSAPPGYHDQVAVIGRRARQGTPVISLEESIVQSVQRAPC